MMRRWTKKKVVEKNEEEKVAVAMGRVSVYLHGVCI